MVWWIRDWWQKVTTKPCDSCGEPVPVSDYRQTGRSRRGEGFLAGYSVEMECPECGHTFWVRK